MSMVAGTVSVDPGTGFETYIPNDGTNAARQLYLLLVADQTNNMTPSTTITPAVVVIDPITYQPTITAPAQVNTIMVPVPITPAAKQAQAKVANTMAKWMVTYIQTNAKVSGTTDTTSSNANQPLKNGAVL